MGQNVLSHELFVIALLVAVIGGFSFCAAMNAHRGFSAIEGGVNCNVANFASALLPPKISDQTPLLLIISYLSLILLAFSRRIFGRHFDGDNARSFKLKTFLPLAAIYDPLRDVLRRGIMHPKLCNF